MAMLKLDNSHKGQQTLDKAIICIQMSIEALPARAELQKLSVMIDIGSRVLLTGGSAMHCDAESTPMNREGGDTSSTWLAS
eukprot:7021-Heterococcus_DN1.PRE.2